MKKFIATLAASLSLLGATAAQANSAQSLSLSNAPAVRASTDAGKSSELAGGSAFGYVLIAVVVGAAIWGIIEIADDSDSN